MTINEIQDEVIEEFDEFTEWMDKYQMLIDLGNELEGLGAEYKTEQNFNRRFVKAEYGFNAILRTINWYLQPILMHLSQRESLPFS